MKINKNLSFKELDARIYNLITLKKFDYAIKELEERLKYNPESTDILAFFPYVNYYKGDTDLAIEQSKTILAKSTNYFFIYKILGESYLSKGQYKKAREIIDIGLEIHPNEFHLLFTKARYLTAVRDIPKALEIVEIALRIDPNDADLLTFKAKLITNKSEAKKTLDLALEKNPLNADSFLQKGVISMEEDNAEKARDYFLEALKLSPDNKKIKHHLHAALCKIHTPYFYQNIISIQRYGVRIFLLFTFIFISTLVLTIYAKFTTGKGDFFLPIFIPLLGISLFLVHRFLLTYSFHYITNNPKTEKYFYEKITKKDCVKLFIIAAFFVFLLFVVYFYYRM